MRRALPERLNLGCGHNPLEGWVNVDVRRGPGVDLVLDLDGPDCLPFAGGSVGVVRAHALLEHLRRWEDLVLEVARALRPGGVFEVRVPRRWAFAPYHVRAFGPRSFDPFRSDAIRFTSDLRHAWHVGGISCEFDGAHLFTL